MARIDEVTLYASGARVRRTTTVEAGATRLRIEGLPLAVIDDTLRVEIDGPAIATAISAGRDVPAAAAAAPELTAELRTAELAVALADAEVLRLASALAAIERAPLIEERDTDEPLAPWEPVLAARQALVATRAARELALREQYLAARAAQEAAQRSLAAAADREARASGDRAPKLHELRKHVDIELEPFAGASGTLTVTLEYLVAAARWVPSYVARLDGERTRVEIRASVAQATGEDWRGVRLRLSTAEPARFATLPVLAAQRIGRRQAEPAKRGFRPAPVGAAALYADYDRDRPAVARPLVAIGLAEIAVHDDDEADALAAPGGPPPMLQAAAPALAMAKRRQSARGGIAFGGGGAADELQRLDRTIAPAPAPARLDYGALRMAPLTSPARGTLVPARDAAGGDDDQIAAAAARVAHLPLPPGCHARWAHSYDYAFAADGTVDIAADGAWHSLAITAQPATAAVHHVATPREQADVFRLATLANPFAGPLLPGPIDIYDGGRFLVTSAVDFTPPGGTVEVGLGVDAAVKIARNTEFREEATGMLRGGLRLHHAITIDIENVSARAIDLEVRERVPVTSEGDDEVEVVLARVEPAWERFTPAPDAPGDRKLRGGYRWRLGVAPGQKRTLKAGYEVKIAAKHELAGGNRRES